MAENLFEFSTAEANERMEALAANPYPGRGIIIGKSQDGESVLQVYWVMGRSDNSRNRLLVEEAGVVKTVPHDVSKVEDPSLIIYNAMRQFRRHHVVSNGDQTDTVVEYLRQARSFKSALITRTYEPDAPNYTPRITAMITTDTPDTPFSLSIIRKDAQSDRPLHQFYGGFMGRVLARGSGLCVHTYEADGNPLPPFDTEPYGVLLGKGSQDTAQMYWELLNAENRVGLAVKQVDVSNGDVSFAIINQLEGQDNSLSIVP